MIPLIACVALAQQNAGAPPSGADLISKMFAYYARATSLSGTITMTQKAQSTSVTLNTTIAYETPSKLYLKQVLNSSQPRTWMVTSDGTDFSYDYPNDRRFAGSKTEPGRLEEPVNFNGNSLNYQDIFRAALRSLGDLGIPELLAIGGRTNFSVIKGQIATIEYGGTSKIGGVTVVVLKGTWRSAPQAVPSAKYEMDITPEGELKRYSQDEIFGMKTPSGTIPPQEILTTWDVDLKVDAKPDESLFKVVKTGL